MSGIVQRNWITHTMLVRPITLEEYGNRKEKKKMQLPHNPATVLLGAYPRNRTTSRSHKNQYTNVYSSFNCNNPKLKVTQMSFTGEMMKQNNEAFLPWNSILQ